MKNHSRRAVLGVICFSFLCFVMPQAKAQGNVIELLEAIKKATENTADNVITMLASLQAFGKSIVDALETPTPDIASTTKGNTQITTASDKAKTDFKDPLMERAIETLLTTSPGPKQNLLLAETTSLPGPDFPSYSSYKVGPSMQLTLPNKSGPSAFSFDSLVGEVAFSDGAKDNNCQDAPGKQAASQGKPLCQSYAAQSVISYLSGLSNPPSIPQFDKLVPPTYTQTQIDQFRNTPKVQVYLSSLRSYTASQSVGLSNLYHLYAERIIQPGLGKTLDVHHLSTVGEDGKIKPGELIPDVSPLQAQEYLARRRVDDPAWYKQMEESTSPLAISRETLYLLAEIRLELYNNRMQTERLIATLTALHLDNLRGQKTLLDTQATTIELPKTADASRFATLK